jgi:hypothetical protein
MGKLRSLNPVLPELIFAHAIMLVAGELVIVLFLPHKAALGAGWLVGTLYAVFSLVNMAENLDKAAYSQQKQAVIYVIGGYLVRLLVMLLLEAALFYVWDLPGMFSGLAAMFSMKVSAHMQPLTHKLILKTQTRRRR